MNKTNKNSDRRLSLPQKFMVPCQALKPTVRKPRQHNLSTLFKTDEEIVLRMHKSVEQFEQFISGSCMWPPEDDYGSELELD